MNRVKALINILFFSFFFVTCSDDFLEVRPSGTLDKFTLANEQGIEALLIGAYSMLDGVSEYIGGWESSSSNWLYGSVRGMEANKGTDAGDSNGNIIPIRSFYETASNTYTTGYLNKKWTEVKEYARMHSIWKENRDTVMRMLHFTFHNTGSTLAPER